MRRLLVLTATFALLGATACSSSKSQEESDEKATQQQAQSEEGKKESEEKGEKQGKHTAEKAKKKKKKRRMQKMCPMAVEGVKLASSKTDTGAAVALTTESGDVDELRKRVGMMAKHHNKKHGHMEKGKKKKKKGKKGKGKGKKKKKMAEWHKALMKSPTSTEEIEKGVRLKWKKGEGVGHDKLAEGAEKWAGKMEKRECKHGQMKKKEKKKEKKEMKGKDEGGG